MTSPRTLVIIPVFNEEAALLTVLDDLRKMVPGCDLLVVDDGSTDKSAALAGAAGVPVARLPFNLGIGAALRVGFRYARRHGYERAVQFDGDGQHDAKEISKLLGALDQDADMAIGSRFATEDAQYKAGAVRSGAMRLLRLLVHLLSGMRFTDTSSGFRAFGAPVIEYFATTYPAEYMDSVESLLLALYAGFNIVEVPVRMNHRSGGTPSNRTLRLIYHYLRLLIVLISSLSLKARKERR